MGQGMSPHPLSLEGCPPHKLPPQERRSLGHADVPGGGEGPLL